MACNTHGFLGVIVLEGSISLLLVRFSWFEYNWFPSSKATVDSMQHACHKY